jgi:hypothetical protein
MLKRTLIAATLALVISAGAVAQQGVPQDSGQQDPTLQDRVDALAQQIYRRYQHYPPALAARRAAAEEVLSAWNQVAPEGEEQASAANVTKISEWLDAALRAVMPGGGGELPAAPEFEEAPEFQKAVVEEEPVVETEEVLADDSLPTPVREVIEPSVTTAPTETVAPTVDPEVAPALEPRRSRIKVSDPVVTIDNPYVNDAEVATQDPAAPKPSINPLRQSPRPADQLVESQPTESQFAGPRATAKPVVPAPEAVDEAVDKMNHPAPQRSKWSQHPAAAPLEWRDPFADDPAASPNPLRSGSRHETRRPEHRLSRTTKVNLRQLSADIRGYNAALRSLQSAVMQLKETDIAALAAAEEELDRLDERRQFLDLYREGLTTDEERVLPESPSAEVVRELVRRKTETLSDRASSSQRDERRAQQTDWFESF